MKDERAQVAIKRDEYYGGLLLMGCGGLKIAVGRLKRAGVTEDVVLLETLDRILYSAAVAAGVVDQ